MEITVVSAQGLKNTSSLSSLLSHHLKPFIVLTTTPPSTSAGAGAGRSHVYRTTVDHEGGENPTWGDKFDLSNVINASFFYQKYSCIYLRLYTKRLVGGDTLLGWCRIPATDIADGFSPAGTVRQLSYWLRKGDGSRGYGVVNVVVKLESSIFQDHRRGDYSGAGEVFETRFGRMAIGIPVKGSPAVGHRRSAV